MSATTAETDTKQAKKPGTVQPRPEVTSGADDDVLKRPLPSEEDMKKFDQQAKEREGIVKVFAYASGDYGYAPISHMEVPDFYIYSDANSFMTTNGFRVWLKDDEGKSLTHIHTSKKKEHGIATLEGAVLRGPLTKERGFAICAENLHPLKRPADMTIKMDGKVVGKFRVLPRDTITVERSAADTDEGRRKFRFVAEDSEVGAKAGVVKGRKENGVFEIKVEFGEAEAPPEPVSYGGRGWGMESTAYRGPTFSFGIGSDEDDPKSRPLRKRGRGVTKSTKRSKGAAKGGWGGGEDAEMDGAEDSGAESGGGSTAKRGAVVLGDVSGQKFTTVDAFKKVIVSDTRFINFTMVVIEPKPIALANVESSRLSS